MKFTQREQDEVSLNLAPLIDVVFLLLIFFMVTTSFTQEKAIDLTLPEASSEQPREKGLVINITVTQLGEIIVEDDQSRFSGINDSEDRQALRDKIESSINKILGSSSPSDAADPTIIIQADKAANYGRVVQLMDTIARMGIRKIQFAVDPEQP